MGVMRVRKTGELFPGAHEPLVNKQVFDRVQMILEGKTVDRVVRHDFTFRRMLRCTGCERSLIGELQKGHVYYRCQTRQCPTKTIREEIVDSAVSRMLSLLELGPHELEHATQWMRNAHTDEHAYREKELQAATLRLDSVRSRVHRLTDAFIDGLLEKTLFEQRKNALVGEEGETREMIQRLNGGSSIGLQQMEEFLELVKNAPFVYKHANAAEKREMLRSLVSNLRVTDRNVSLEPKPGVHILINRPRIAYGAPSRGVHRTWNGILEALLKVFTASSDERQPSIKTLKAAA
jgi:site-specific DNA recombinase